jgi:hypothetical protein
VSVPGVSICLLVHRDAVSLDRTLAVLLPQTAEGDEVLVAPLVACLDPVAVAERVRESASRCPGHVLFTVWDGPRGTCAGSPAAARNRVLAAAGGDVVALLDDGGLPCPGWLEAVRACFAAPGLEAMAGRIVTARPTGCNPGEPESGHRSRRRPAAPGARLRWTGHLATGLDGTQAGPSSLASARNAAVLRRTALRLRGFDEKWGPDLPYEDVEFFVRLGKAGRRMRFEPTACVELVSGGAFPEGGEPGPEGSPLRNLERQAARTRAMAAIFARHEVWALPLLLASHELLAGLEAIAGRLPPRAPFRLAAEIAGGVRLGVGSVQSPWNTKCPDTGHLGGDCPG